MADLSDTELAPAVDLLAADVHWLTVYPDGTVQDAVAPEDDDYDDYQAEGLYQLLLEGGYPRWLQPGSDYDGVIDLLTDGCRVVARTGPDGGQVVMPPPADKLLLDWYRTAEIDDREP